MELAEGVAPPISRSAAARLSYLATPAWLGEKGSNLQSTGSKPAGLPIRLTPSIATCEHRDQDSNLESSGSEPDVIPIPLSLYSHDLRGDGRRRHPVPVHVH